MFQKIDLNKLLFSEIEAVPKKSTFNEISKTEKELFPYKIKHQHSEDQRHIQSPPTYTTQPLWQFSHVREMFATAQRQFKDFYPSPH